MSHSTHVGFRLPPAWAASVGVFRSDSLGAFVSFALCAVGVVHETTVASFLPVFPAGWTPPVDAVGVGHRFRFAIVCRLGLTFPTRPALPPWFVP